MSGNEMYFIKRWFFRRLFRLLKIKPTDMPMVKYWKTKEAAQAKVTTNEDGALVMYIEGEKEPFPGFPRSHVLFGDFRGTGYGPMSVLKHTIKNEIFNESWKLLEEGKSIDEHIKNVLPKIFQIADEIKYDMIPPEKMFKGVREIWRAMTVLEEKYQSKTIGAFKKVICFILSDDDAYRMRVQFLIPIFSMFRNPIENFDIALQELEHAEVISDMKERIRLLRRVLLAF
jgi:hypothetical protein